MSDGIQERDVETYTDEDLEYNTKLGIFSRIPATTTQRRVGRSIKAPPGPSVDDAAEGDAADSASGAQDELGSVLISRLDNLLGTPDGLSQFFDALDGQSEDQRTPEDVVALEQTMEDLNGTHILTMPVRKIAQRPAPLPNPEGELDLRANIRIEDGLPVLWVNDGLIVEERRDEIIRCLAEEIEMSATENAVPVNSGGVAQLLRRLSA